MTSSGVMKTALLFMVAMMMMMMMTTTALGASSATGDSQRRSTTSSLNWLSMARPLIADFLASNGSVDYDERRPVTPPGECYRNDALTGRQRVLLCQRHAQLVDAVRQAAFQTLSECRHQFRNDPWNCPLEVSLGGRKTQPQHVPIEGTREMAFVQALATASLSLSVTRRCSSGELTECGCDQTSAPSEQLPNMKSAAAASTSSSARLLWSGCSDNIDYGVAFSTAFVDLNLEAPRARNHAGRRSEGVRDEQNERAVETYLTNLHNGNAGRKAVESGRRIQCKCHGISGSCDVRTCWHAAPAFRHVTDSLRARYDGAVRVRLQRPRPSGAATSSSSSAVDRLVPVAASKSSTSTPAALPASSPPPQPEVTSSFDARLVYFRSSPDYCPATVGRPCGGPDDCARACCGRGHATRRRVVIDARCRCRFHYCCRVTCEPCERIVDEFVCL